MTLNVTINTKWHNICYDTKCHYQHKLNDTTSVMTVSDDCFRYRSYINYYIVIKYYIKNVVLFSGMNILLNTIQFQFNFIL